jgi:hypothetical protein
VKARDSARLIENLAPARLMLVRTPPRARADAHLHFIRLLSLTAVPA